MIAEILRIHPDEPEPAHIDQVVQCAECGPGGRAADGHVLRAGGGPGESARGGPDLRAEDARAAQAAVAADRGVGQAYELAPTIDGAFDRLAERFWPGPLTIVVKAGAKLPLRVTANTGNVALRVPEAAIARAVVSRLGLPITATSANLRACRSARMRTACGSSLGTRFR